MVKNNTVSTTEVI